MSLARATFILAVIASFFACTAHVEAATAVAAPALPAIADEFYGVRARFDPLNYATANGDSRYDDQLGMTIDPMVRANYFAEIHRLQKQLGVISPVSLNEAERLNRDILAFELRADPGCGSPARSCGSGADTAAARGSRVQIGL
jgi:hypothetical protein